MTVLSPKVEVAEIRAGFAAEPYETSVSEGAVKIVAFNAADGSELNRLGLLFPVISRIFLGPADAGEPNVTPESPSWAKFFIRREFRACEDQFRSLEQEFEWAIDPQTGEPASLEYCFVSKTHAGMTLPVFKVFGAGADRFCLVFAGLLSRVSHIILPALRCVIYDLDRSSSESLWAAFSAHAGPAEAVSARRPRIGLVDMVTSYAHQAMNYLSGIQRLIDADLVAFLDEIWVCGIEFFGPTEIVFPEIGNKIRHVSRHAAAERLSSAEHYILKLGSNFITKALRQRLLNITAPRRFSVNRGDCHSPLIAFTVRSNGRCCKNLSEMIDQIVQGLLQDYPNLGVVLDGWVFPETSIIAQSHFITALAEPYLSQVREDALLCQEISSRLPPGVLVHTTVGYSFLESIDILKDVDLYVAHSGTLQHKIAWFTQARGIVHGPQAELSRMETSYYACEMSRTPIFVNVDDVVDVSDGESRNDRFNDYFLLDSSKIIRTLKELISNDGARL